MSTLATNNITNEPGTGGPDFSHMPSVGGDPVVESGSNSDGEWTKFADGTQIVRFSVIFVETGTVIVAPIRYHHIGPVTLPAAFVDNNYHMAATVTRSSVGQMWADVNGTRSTSQIERVICFSDSNEVNGTAKVTITGRWK